MDFICLGGFQDVVFWLRLSFKVLVLVFVFGL